MQARHIILIIVIVLLVILIWYNREKWKNKFKVDGGGPGKYNNRYGMVSLYLEYFQEMNINGTVKSNGYAIKCGFLSYKNDSDEPEHTNIVPRVLNEDGITQLNSSLTFEQVEFGESTGSIAPISLSDDMLKKITKKLKKQKNKKRMSMKERQNQATTNLRLYNKSSVKRNQETKPKRYHSEHETKIGKQLVTELIRRSDKEKIQYTENIYNINEYLIHKIVDIDERLTVLDDINKTCYYKVALGGYDRNNTNEINNVLNAGIVEIAMHYYIINYSFNKLTNGSKFELCMLGDNDASEIRIGKDINGKTMYKKNGKLDSNRSFNTIEELIAELPSLLWSHEHFILPVKGDITNYIQQYAELENIFIKMVNYFRENPKYDKNAFKNVLNSVGVTVINYNPKITKTTIKLKP